MPEDKEITECPICLTTLPGFPSYTTDQEDLIYQISCTRCGEFSIARRAIATFTRSKKLGGKDCRNRANLSSWLREKQLKDTLWDTFVTEYSNYPIAVEFWATPEPSFHEKANKLLRFIQEKTEYAGQPVNWDKETNLFMARSWSLNEDELIELIKYLAEQRRISGGVLAEYRNEETDARILPIRIQPDGWAYLEKMGTSVPKTDQAFIAMWFIGETDNAWAAAILPALGEAGYYPQKIDMKQHNNKIDDEIIAEIRKSKFLVADLTGHRGGVYFEAGFAKGLGLEVIWTCRDDHFDNLHFDIRQYACIKWKEANLDAFKKELRNRIEATLGRGNYKPNPA